MTTLTSQESLSPGPIEAVKASAGTRNDNEATKVKQKAMLDGPVLPVLLKLALPTVVVLVVQTLVGVAETYFVSFLGTEAIAGVSLVFPIFMLMQMMSNGGIGGGVASSIARRTDAGAVHGDRSSFCEIAPQESACAGQGIAFAQQFEKICERRVIVILAPVR